MLRKAGDSLGTVNGVTYKEYFDDSSHTVLTPSPKKLSTYEPQKEEIFYKVSSVFTLHEEDEVKPSEQKHSEEFVEPEDDEKDKDALHVVERPDVPTPEEHIVVTEVPTVGSQGDTALSEDLQATAVEKYIEFSPSMSPPALEKGHDYRFDTERSRLSDSEHSLVSSTKVEVGSQPDLGSVDASSYELVSLIGSSLVSKPLMEAQSEGKCQKKKKTSKKLRRVSKSVPHVVPEEMQHLNDFSRVVTQEAIYAEMSSGDDAFAANQDQYEDEEESSYSSESDDDASQTNSQEIDDLAIESSSSFPAPAAPPASATSSPDGSSSAASHREVSQSSDSTFQDESGSRISCGQGSLGLELLTESYIDQLGHESSEGLMSNILEHPEMSLSSLSPERNTDVENSKSPSPRATGSACVSTTTASSRQEERECKARRLERLVEKLCHDFVAQNPAVKQNPASLVSYFENAGAIIRSLPVTEMKRSFKNVSKDISAAATPTDKSQASSESSQVASLDSIRPTRR
ncbi:uncharacterized protein LOC126095636 [Schistocerca cancellata]|uniref:uncharacterized protein LOC126095636 n=1 Tax=Schistocerca cancellata TaxID=274614 RepID=UPI00211956C6|nr:uncharacterized protein LOC126095636 [Schistocerca cancellata]